MKRSALLDSEVGRATLERMSPARYVLALDEGSTGVRALLFDRQGNVKGRAYREVAALSASSHASLPRSAKSVVTVFANGLPPFAT